MDDGERLNALFKSAKDNIVDGSKALASTSKVVLDKAADTSKKIASSQQVQGIVDKANVYMGKSSTTKFFYLLSDSTPKGPVKIEEIIMLAEDPNWVEQVRLSEVGTEQWMSFEEWTTLHTQPTLQLQQRDI